MFCKVEPTAIRMNAIAVSLSLLKFLKPEFSVNSRHPLSSIINVLLKFVMSSDVALFLKQSLTNS